MRVVYLGGTRFIGEAAVRRFEQAGHDVVVIHRSESSHCRETDHVSHLHADRRDLASRAGQVAEFAPDVVVDGIAYSRRDADRGHSLLAGGRSPRRPVKR